MVQLVDKPTRYDASSSNILDLVISSYPDLIDILQIGTPFSDHCTISFKVKDLIQHPIKNSQPIYQYHKANFDLMRKHLLNVYITVLFNASAKDINII